MVSGPSLDFLLPAVDALLAQVLEPFVTAVDDLLEPVADAVDVPTIDGTVAQLRDLLDLPILTDDSPIVSIVAAGSSAAMTLDRATGVHTPASTPATVSIALGDAFAALLGEDLTSITVAAGQTQTLFAGTPLESTISVGDASAFDPSTEELTGEGVRVTGVDLDLLLGVDGGIGVDVGSAQASVITAAASASTPGEQLPSTGGGAALLGVGAMAAAAALRRR